MPLVYPICMREEAFLSVQPSGHPVMSIRILSAMILDVGWPFGNPIFNAANSKLIRLLKSWMALRDRGQAITVLDWKRVVLPASLAGDALGTIGGGNHFAELQRVDEIVEESRFQELGFDETRMLLLVHSGSRGLGQAILQKHLRDFNNQGLKTNDEAFVTYLTKHDQAMSWARLNRDIIAERFLDRLNTRADRKLDIFHNSVTRHQDGWLHRKGAAPSDKGLVVIPGSRGAMTYLVEPKTAGANISLHSLAHGAGRKWKRTEAKGQTGSAIYCLRP